MYNLNKDPHEVHNLPGNNPERANYAAKAEELVKCLLDWLEKNHSEHFNGVKERELI